MQIGLIDVDSHNFPNLALMKLSAYHKARGDSVEWWNGLKQYDRVYQSKVFTELYTPDNDFVIMADEIIKGGTGYDLKNKLPDVIEHTYPDYSLYNISDTAYGFLTRGCPRRCPFCIVSEKEGTTRTVADLSEWYDGQNNIVLMDSNITASKDCEKHFEALADTKAIVNFEGGLDIRFIDEAKTELLNKIRVKEIHFAWDDYKDKHTIVNLRQYAKRAKHKPHGFFGTVYVLTNFNTTHDEDLERIYKLREMNYAPYVMIYDKPNAPKITKQMQRWCNNKYIFGSCERFEDYRRANE